MNTDTNAASQEVGIEPNEPNDPFVTPVEPALKSERLQEESAEPVVQAG